MTHTSDVLVIGGGLHGLSTALHLAQAGINVSLLEKDSIGRHASSANAGGVRQLGRALPEIPLAIAALKIWHNIQELVDDDCGFVNSGQIKVAETQAHYQALKERSRLLNDLGYQHEEVIGKDELYDLLPALAPDCAGGMIVRSDGHANPFQTVQAFRRKAISVGANIYENALVAGLEKTNDIWQAKTSMGTFEAPVVVNAAGAWAEKIASMLGDHTPVNPQALMLMITERLKPFIGPVVGTQGRSLSFKQFKNGTVLIGGGYTGTSEPNRNKTVLDIKGLSQNAAAAAAIFPCMKHANIVRCWAGIEGKMLDDIPVIGHGTEKGVFHIFGFSGHGFALSPIVGKVITDLIINHKTDFQIEAFRASRFMV